MILIGGEKPPSFSELVAVVPLLERELDVLIVPTLGVPIRPGPLGAVFPTLKRIFDSHRCTINSHADEVRDLIFSPKLDSVPQDKSDDVTPYWGNAYFQPGDARLAYAVVARYQPSQIIEIGCGNSTKFLRRAVDDYQLATRITCIDPHPREDIAKVADEFHQATLPTIDLDVFSRLKAGDVLFLDGSHLVMNGSDCVHFFLNILPELPKGVWVHLHDIFLPYDYPSQLFIDCKSNEQYTLAMLFLFSQEWVPVLPIYYAYREGILPHGGGSLWMKRQ